MYRSLATYTIFFVHTNGGDTCQDHVKIWERKRKISNQDLGKRGKKKMEEIMKGNGQTQSCKEIRMKTDLYILHLY